MKKTTLIILTALAQSCSTQPVTGIHTGPQYKGDTDFIAKAKNPTFKDFRPTVCFDEGHNNLAVHKGFYKPVLDLVESDGYIVIHKNESFTKSSLKDCSILYISAVLGYPDYKKNKELARKSAFADTEILAITNWVKNGGSLLLMTDHKPMGSAAGKLLAEFEVFGSDVNVRNPKNPIPPFLGEGIFFISEQQMNLNSAIVKGRTADEQLKKIYFFYGQALKGPKDADAFLTIGEGAVIGGLYNDKVLDAKEFPAAALALKVKKGRLVVFGDATVFTSKMDLWINEPTGINRPGSDNIQMALNVFHWLSGVLE